MGSGDVSDGLIETIRTACLDIPCPTTRAVLIGVTDALDERPTFDVGVMRLQPGDKVLVRISKPVFKEQVAMIQQHVQSFVGADYPVSVIGQEMSIEIVRGEG